MAAASPDDNTLSNVELVPMALCMFRYTSISAVSPDAGMMTTPDTLNLTLELFSTAATLVPSVIRERSGESLAVTKVISLVLAFV